MQKSWGVYLFWIVVIGVIGGALWYIARSPGSPSQPEPVQPPSKSVKLNPEDYPKLQERLVGLVEAADPAAFAKENGFEDDFKDGKVVVVIEAQSFDVLEELRWAIEALDGRLETEYEMQLQILLLPAALIKLAKHPHIQYIRLPVNPQPESDG